ncbi:arginase family protein [Numidum massiliense]|uniref:arginase family protein n=1 Tax=Numidum massiliense TaxID=1522315 RepID=UPI000A6F20DD
MYRLADGCAPGVSAPTPFGLDPNTAKHLIEEIVTSGNVSSFDIAKVYPALGSGRANSAAGGSFVIRRNRSCHTVFARIVAVHNVSSTTCRH